MDRGDVPQHGAAVGFQLQCVEIVQVSKTLSNQQINTCNSEIMKFVAHC